MRISDWSSDVCSSDLEWPDALSLAQRHRRLPRGQAVEEMPGFNEGGWWVQDLAASLPARLLGAGEGRTVLDLCAAPGGTTMQLAAAGCNVIAVDDSTKQHTRTTTNMERQRPDAASEERDTP